MGFCGSVKANGKPSHVDDYIPKRGPVSSNDFADWVLLAEGMKPEKDYTYKPQFKKLFVDHMGADIVDASLLK
jgi:hypothetical protein